MSEFKYDVFISYKTEEAAFAREVNEVLSEKYNVFFSERTLHNEASDDFEENIKEALLSSLVLLNVGMSMEYLSGVWLKKEREYFIPLRDFSSRRRKVFNIVPEGFDIKNDLPDDLKRWNTRCFPVDEEALSGLIQNAKELNASTDSDFSLTNKPDELNFQYEKDVFRETSFSKLDGYFSNLEENIGMMYVYGSAGVGKTSFMTKAFTAYENEPSGKYIYYIKGDDDINAHLDKISEALSKSFENIAHSNELHIGFKDILELSDASTKIEKLFYSYSKEIYSKTKISFTLFVDAADTLKDEKKFIRTLVQNYQGIHFVFSGRVPPEHDFLVHLKEENRKLDIFKEGSDTGLKLSNLEDALTLQYIANNLDPEKKLSNKERKTIQDKILGKSRGLPKYFELLLSKANTISKSGDKKMFEKMVMEIDSAPEELTDYYIQIFKAIQKEDTLAMKMLEVLYWYSDTGISRQILAALLDIENVVIFDNALHTVEYLIKAEENDAVAINHLSISEALFTYYASFSGPLTARKLDTEFMQRVFEKDPILLYLAKYNSDIYTLLSSVYYFDDKNTLFQVLKHVVDFYINKRLMKNDDPLNLYFSYSKIVFIRHMLRTDALKDEIGAADLFSTADSSLAVVSEFNEKVYRQYTGREIVNVFDLRKMVFMTVLDQNTYYQSKYLKKYFEYTYSEKYKKIFNVEQLTKRSLKGLLSNLSRTYVAMRSKLSGKALDPKLGIYEDLSLVMLYDETKSSNKNKKVVDTIQSAQAQRRKFRGFLDKQKRYYMIIKTASNVELKKYFYNTLYYYAKQHKKLDSDMKNFLNDIAVDMLLSDIENLVKEDKFYKFLPLARKQEVNHVFNYYLSYSNNGLLSLLKAKNKDDFFRMAVFIKDEDMHEFLQYTDSCFNESQRGSFMYIVSEIVRHTDNKENLLLCRQYMKEFLGSVGDTPIMITLLIAYKLNDLKALVAMEGEVVKQEYEKEERGIIQALVGNIDNSLDKYWDILKQRRVSTLNNDLRRYFKEGNYDLHELAFFKTFILEDEVIYEKMIESSYAMCDVKKLKYLFLFLQEHNLFRDEDKKVFALNIELLDNIENFVKHMQAFDYDFQIAFLNKILTPDKTRIILGETFLRYVFVLLENNKISANTVKFLGRFYYHKSFYLFAQEHTELVRNVYAGIPENGNLEEVHVKSMLYRNLLAVKGEEAYSELNEEEWIPEDQKLKIASSLIFLTEIEESALFLADFLDNITDRDLDKIKIQIYMGIVFKNTEVLDKGIKALVSLRDASGKWDNNKYNNYLSFTLSFLLPLEVSQLVSNIFTTYDFNYYHLNHFINADTFLDTGKYDVSLVNNAGEFSCYYTLFNELGKKLELSDFDEGIFTGNFDTYMMVMYDLYKEAELKDNEEDHSYYISLFNTLKEEKKSAFEARFEDLSSVTLDNYFDVIIKSDTFSLESIKNDYHAFYMYIKELLENDDESRFNNIMDEIKCNEEYFSILTEKSSVRSKLQMKAANIIYFAPIE